MGARVRKLVGRHNFAALKMEIQIALMLLMDGNEHLIIKAREKRKGLK
jgi:hypothetical protein